MTDDIPTTIARVLELDAAGTPGEWRPGRSDMVSYGLNDGPWKNVYVDDPRGGVHHTAGETLPYAVARGEGDECVENAQLIAYYRTAAPLLARECERLQRQVEALTKERDAAIRTAVDHQRVNNSLTVKLDEYLTGRKVTSMLATERTRVVEAIARRFDTEAIRWAILRDQHGDASDSLKCKWLSDKATEDAKEIRDTNWARPRRNGNE